MIKPEQVYSRLLDIGCSNRVASALAIPVSEMSETTREAFFIWACGMSYRKAARLVGINTSTLVRAIAKIRKNIS